MFIESMGGMACAAAGLMAYAVRSRSSSLFGPSVWRGASDRASIALTFDDGPSESTPELLSVLERLVVGSVAITARAIAAADADLTFMQWRVLLVVGECEDGHAVGEIATRIGAHASPASRVVSRLKRRGLVSTSKREPDKRVVCIRLTETGRNLRARVLPYEAQISPTCSRSCR